MTGRAAWVVLLVGGCNAQLGPGGDDTPAVTSDAKVWSDAAIDSPADARPCMGGDKAQVGPDGSCFVFVSTPKIYVDAKAACAAMNAHLAYLKTAQLDAFAETFVGLTNTWIGLTDRATEGTFVWDDGSALAFTSWGTDEPNNGGNMYQEDCGLLAGAKVDKAWDDRPCDATEIPTSGNFAYLCQY
jgi:hypothetical protein